MKQMKPTHFPLQKNKNFLNKNFSNDLLASVLKKLLKKTIKPKKALQEKKSITKKQN